MMSANILEVLMNAEHNLRYVQGRDIGLEQLHNAIELLDKNYPIHADVDPLLAEYGTVENVPEHEE